MYLPLSPSNEEKYLYLDSGRHRLYVFSVITTLLLIIGMAMFVWLNPFFIPYTFFFVVSFIYLFCSYGIGLIAKDFDFKKHEAIKAKWFDRCCRQDVDIFLPVCGEPIEVIRNTWEHVFGFRLAHEMDGGLAKVHVLDDGKSNEVRDLAEQFKFNYIRRETNELKKAGNLRNAFKQTSAEFVVIFDADFCPRKDFLIETLPYMYENDNLAIVQTPQFFETQTASFNVIERGSAQIQELFYRLIQVSRDYFGGAICVGTSAVYRRKHLEPYGGTAPIEWSEDVHTAVMLMQDKREVKYVPLIMSKGQCPTEWRQFFTQFYRWATGSLSLMKDPKFWQSNLTWMQKLCFTTGFGFYVTTGMFAVLAFTPSIYLLIFKPEYLKWWNILWSIPSLLLTNVYLRYWQKTGYSFSAICCRAVSSYAHLFSLYDLFTGRVEAWVPTGTKARSNRFEFFRKFIILHNLILSGVLFYLINLRFDEAGWVNLLPLLILFSYHLITLGPVLKYCIETELKTTPPR